MKYAKKLNQKSEILDRRPYSIDLGFTLIELLVSISIIGIILGLSLFGLQGARESSRDARRKADLEQIRSGIELFKSDCNQYPDTADFPAVGAALVGNPTLATNCLATNTYISAVPGDPLDPDYLYKYSSTGTTYELCASLEQTTASAINPCAGSANCGSVACYYKVTNP